MKTSRPVAADWLALRRAADSRARGASLPLLAELRQHLMRQKGPVTVHDIGAGTGANQDWLAPRLGAADLGGTSSTTHATPPLDQVWLLLDHDANLLDLAAHLSHPRVLATRRAQARVEDLPSHLAAVEGPRLLSCSALLDLLTSHQIELLCRACVATGTPALLALSVTGEVRLSPAHPDDQRINAAFDAHQHRGADDEGPDDIRNGAVALAGPDGWRLAQEAFERMGWVVRTARTDWELGRELGLAQMSRRFLTDRIEAVSELAEHRGDCDLADAAQHWLAARLASLDRGELRIDVGHRDLLALPPDDGEEPTSTGAAAAPGRGG